MLRIGCVKYLNARPLIRGWLGPVEFDHPSTLGKRLANGEFDVALVSSFEFLRNPIYRIVDDVSISSNGPVYSVIVAHRGEITEIKEIELDPASETSINLLRCLLADLELNPRLVRRVARAPVMTKSALVGRAQLFIGDQAIYIRQEYANEFCFWDLGEQWRKFVGLPFVYALWLIRPEVADPKGIANALRASCEANLANLDNLVGEVVGGVDASGQRKGVGREFLWRYYTEHLRFGFEEKEKEGLRIFANLCIKHGLLPERDLAFRVV